MRDECSSVTGYQQIIQNLLGNVCVMCFAAAHDEQNKFN